jgi:very-short-patch-repair endonuclease
MLQNEKTIKKYSYSIDSLTNGSSKKVVVSCDYCNLIFDKPLKARIIQNKELDKDCCSKCKFKKREELSLLKHGVKNSAQRDDVKLCDYNIEDYKDSILDLLNQDYSISNISNKLNIPQTSLKRYLNKIGIDTKGDLQKKKKKTFVEKYGENHQDVFLKKRQATNLAKYGHDNVFANDDIKDKIVETMRTKYGADHHMQTDSMKERVKNTNLEKYGYENIAQSPEIQNKIKNTNLNKYGYEQATKHPDVKKKIVNTMIINGNARLFEGNNASFWAEQTGYCLSRFNQLVREYGFENAKNMYRTDSYTSLELMFKSFLDEYELNYTTHQRLNINDKYYIPDFMLNNLIVEVDGLYWHSDNCRPDDYHINKKNCYENSGYDSLCFREDEIRDKFEIVKSMVLNRLNRSTKIFARKCHLDKLDDKSSDSYFETNHLMGKGRGTTYILTFNNDVVAALRLKRSKGNHYEISRFCNSKFLTVTGAFSKLLKFAVKDKSPDTVMTFIDKRYGKGDYLKSLGFDYVHIYPSFRWTDGFETFHRLKFSGNSGYDHNLFKIYDCGQAKYLYNLK